MSKKDKQKEQEEATLKDAVAKINEVLKETGTVLQPFTQRGENFDFPSVRIALAKDQTNVAGK